MLNSNKLTVYKINQNLDYNTINNNEYGFNLSEIKASLYTLYCVTFHSISFSHHPPSNLRRLMPLSSLSSLPTKTSFVALDSFTPLSVARHPLLIPHQNFLTRLSFILVLLLRPSHLPPYPNPASSLFPTTILHIHPVTSLPQPFLHFLPMNFTCALVRFHERRLLCE